MTKDRENISPLRGATSPGRIVNAFYPPPPPRISWGFSLMRRPWTALLALALLAAFVTLSTEQADAQQASQTLTSNIGQAHSNADFDAITHDNAQAFTTGSAARGYTLTSVDVVFRTISDASLASKLAVTINEDSGGEPGTVLGTLTNPGTIATGTNSFTHAGLELEAGTAYWVVVGPGGYTGALTGINWISLTASDAEDAGGADGWSIGDDGYQNVGGSWQMIQGSWNLRITIKGFATPPPPLVSNFGQANGGTGNFVQHDHAQAFTTGANAGGYTLTGVDFSFPQINDGGLAGS